jgi:5-methyltetrahydrofolate--homocysteine methyltransferase
VAKKYKEMGAALVGANCGTTLENMEAILKEYSETIPGFGLWAKPNAGVPHMDVKTEQGVYDMTPEDMFAYAKKYVAIGVRVVGGCCGSTPSHVAAIAKAAKN